MNTKQEARIERIYPAESKAGQRVLLHFFFVFQHVGGPQWSNIAWHSLYTGMTSIQSCHANFTISALQSKFRQLLDDGAAPFLAWILRQRALHKSRWEAYKKLQNNIFRSWKKLVPINIRIEFWQTVPEILNFPIHGKFAIGRTLISNEFLKEIFLKRLIELFREIQ